MSGEVAHIWRHPIKSHGREKLDTIDLLQGQTMPWDRAWAVAHTKATVDAGEWSPCANFSRVAHVPALQAITSKLDVATNRITLTHPARPELTFDPDNEAQIFLDWVTPLMPKKRPQSSRIIRVPSRGMTDTDFPSISLNNLASNRAVSNQMGTDISPQRWRGNIWLDGLGAWEEFDWIGKRISIGTAEFTVQERIERCKATEANPQTGTRDADTLDALMSGWGHMDFGVYGVVSKSGNISLGDKIRVLS
ncbi:MAG: MOSC domain-containing protein [Marinosulfonomonas sp.]|nr:MOSC domain-containing protein [Marinosulfonomonas sp.]